MNEIVYTNTQVHIIPNTDPGWRAIREIHGDVVDEVVDLEEIPIVAWKIEVRTSDLDRHGELFSDAGVAEPIVADDMGEIHVLRTPTGTYFAPYVCSGMNREGALKYYQDAAKINAERRARRAAKNAKPPNAE